MKLAKALEQGVCILTMLSIQSEGIPVSAKVINKRLKGSSTYIQKIIRKLVVAGLVNSVSGNNGGFALARKPIDINLLEIVEAIDGKIDSYPDSGLFQEVFFDMPFVLRGQDIIHQTVSDADRAWCKSLKNKTIQDIIDSARSIDSLQSIDWNQTIKM